MRVLVTGVTGFLGRHVLHELVASSHDVIALTRNKIDIVDVDAIYGNLEDVKNFHHKIIACQPDVVVHLAWQGIPDYSEQTSKLNLNMSIDLLDAVINNTECKRIIVAGSCWEYGKYNGVCKEDDPTRIDSYFAWAKHSLYEYLKYKCSESQIDLIWFRIFYLYGPGQKKESLIPTLLRFIGEKKTPPVKAPDNRNDYIYVQDAARIFSKSVDLDLDSGIYNLGSGKSTSVHGICRIVAKHLLESDRISLADLPDRDNNKPVNFWADTNKTAMSFGMIPSTSLESGIGQMKSYY